MSRTGLFVVEVDDSYLTDRTAEWFYRIDKAGGTGTLALTHVTSSTDIDRLRRRLGARRPLPGATPGL